MLNYSLVSIYALYHRDQQEATSSVQYAYSCGPSNTGSGSEQSPNASGSFTRVFVLICMWSMAEAISDLIFFSFLLILATSSPNSNALIHDSRRLKDQIHQKQYGLYASPGKLEAR